MSIRPAREEDIPAILAIYGPYVENTTYSFEYTVPTREEFSARFSHHTHYCPWLVWEEDGQVLGYAYGAPAFERAAYGWCAELSIYLAPQIQGQGIGRKLCTVLEQLLFRQGYEVIYAIITSENLGSVAFHEALGFQKRAEFPDCGIKFGRRLGTIWLEKRSISVGIPLNAPALWSQIMQSDEKLINILDNLCLF